MFHKTIKEQVLIYIYITMVINQPLIIPRVLITGSFLKTTCSLMKTSLKCELVFFLKGDFMEHFVFFNYSIVTGMKGILTFNRRE